MLNEDAGTIANVTNIFHTAPFTNRAVSQMGSRIVIDPKDGNLFVSVGDRSTGDPLPLQAQAADLYLGKVIHITPEGKPAPGNPALGLPEFWSMGHRTPQGLAFAPDGRLWETEHGPRGGDELNLIEKGKNYGWPVIVHGINYPGTKIGDAIVEKPGLEQPRYYWDPIIAPRPWCSMRAICSLSGSRARSSARWPGRRFSAWSWARTTRSSTKSHC